MAYESTSVPVERSQGEIRKLLAKHGVGRMILEEARDEFGGRWASVSLAHRGVEVGQKYMRARTKSRDEIRDVLYEQEERRIWRVLAWNLKTRMVAVEEGLETFEEAFLAHLLDERTGQTIYEQLAETGRVELSAPLLALPAGGDE
jgi:hypothetical protein